MAQANLPAATRRGDLQIALAAAWRPPLLAELRRQNRRANLRLRPKHLQAGLPATQMRDQQSLGDTPPAEFRKQLHELADWIADFRENIERLRVAPHDQPGAIREQLPSRAP